MSFKSFAFVLPFAIGALAAACYDGPRSKSSEPAPVATTVDVRDLPGHAGVGVDGRRMQGPRTMAPETYLRSYAMLFGNVPPMEIAKIAKGADQNELFASWATHLGALGLPDYAVDLARSSESNALMLATYERLGIALCDRAVERDLRGGSPRHVFDFALPSDPLDRIAFEGAFDSVHRTFLGYPSQLAGERTNRFYKLYADVIARHSASGAAASRFTPVEAGWAVVCYGLVRHPEFHLY